MLEIFEPLNYLYIVQAFGGRVLISKEALGAHISFTLVIIRRYYSLSQGCFDLRNRCCAPFLNVLESVTLSEGSGLSVVPKIVVDRVKLDLAVID